MITQLVKLVLELPSMIIGKIKVHKSFIKLEKVKEIRGMVI